jgi:hypothetical protein
MVDVGCAAHQVDVAGETSGSLRAHDEPLPAGAQPSTRAKLTTVDAVLRPR